MKILVLGNGFDLDHDLPTSYMDFLNFCNCVLEMDNPFSTAIEKLKPTQKHYVKILDTCEPLKSTFLSLLKNNHLLNYFNKRLETQGENWIDFEREIKGIVNEFKVIEYELRQSKQYSYSIGFDHIIHRILNDLGLGAVDTNTWNEISLSAIHKDLCYSLNNFSVALEYYIYNFVNNTPVKGVSPDIIDFDANKVLTFNYSNTYERFYGGVRWDESIDHVHGVALGILDNEPNIILGITSSEENLQGLYVEFEKYFQRITKKTGNDYKKWLQQRLGNKEKIEVMFFGHSLDSTDSDIIKDLVLNENSIITVYYFNETSYQKIVANLIEMIGKEKLIEYVSGLNPKIQFIQQRNHRIENTAGIEITRDTQKLYKMYTLSNKDIEELLRKLKNKIETKDLAYFYSQKKTISLFDALKYLHIDFATKDTFVDICKNLDFEISKSGGVVLYFEEEWYVHTPWDEDIPCDEDVSKVIKEINGYNKKRYQETQSSKRYAYMLTLENEEEIKKELIRIFEEKNPDKKYWKELSELMGLMYKNVIFEKALRLIRTEPLSLPVRSKFMHFEAAYEENCFKIGYAEEMANAFQNEGS